MYRAESHKIGGTIARRAREKAERGLDPTLAANTASAWGPKTKSYGRTGSFTGGFVMGFKNDTGIGSLEREQEREARLHFLLKRKPVEHRSQIYV